MPSHPESAFACGPAWALSHALHSPSPYPVPFHEACRLIRKGNEHPQAPQTQGFLRKKSLCNQNVHAYQNVHSSFTTHTCVLCEGRGNRGRGRPRRPHPPVLSTNRSPRGGGKARERGRASRRERWRNKVKECVRIQVAPSLSPSLCVCVVCICLCLRSHAR